MSIIKYFCLSILVLCILSIISCGDLKITADLEDEDIDKISDIFGDDDSEDTDDDTTDETDAESVEETGDPEIDETDSIDETDDTDSTDDTTGDSDEYGKITNDQKGVNRTFVGTYSLDPYSSTCDNRYELPANTRAFSHGDLIDFEDSSGNLVWIARLFEDETFDFTRNYLDKFGNPTITLSCTCYIKDGYYSYYNEEIQCNCQGTDSYNTCKIYYDKY